MTRIAAIVSWSEERVTAEDIEPLTRPYSDLDWRYTISRNGAAVLACGVREGRCASIGESTDGVLSLVADADISDPEIPPGLAQCASTHTILRAVDRHRDNAPDRVDGEFAFAWYDSTERRFAAARDPFGIRPLVFQSQEDRLYVASEPKQLLAHRAIPLGVDPLLVGEYLFGRFENASRTFFSGIERLKPACRLAARDRKIQVDRYWNPEIEAHHRTTDQIHAGFRERLTDAVRKRLDTRHATLFDLSGGLDSTALVAMAARIGRQDPAALPRIELVSGRFPGLPCDEGEYIQSVRDRVPFDAHDLFPMEIDPLATLEEDHWHLDAPFADIQRGLFDQIRATAIDRGCTRWITGLGGDELLHEEYILRDLARWGRFASLSREAWLGQRTSWNSFPQLFFDGLKGAVPEPVRRLYWALRGSQWSPPSWANPTFVSAFRENPIVEEEDASQFESWTRQWIYRWMTYPHIGWVLEGRNALAHAAGFSPHHPFFDRSLVEFVLSIPATQRLPGGAWKALVRRGLASDLPRAITERPRKTVFASFDTRVMERCSAPLARRIFDGAWHSEAFVLQIEAERIFSAWKIGVAQPHAQEEMWRIANLELWLRGLAKYGAMRDERAGAPRTTEASKKPNLRRYSTPRVDVLGDMTVVTQKSGGNPDSNQTSKAGKGGG